MLTGFLDASVLIPRRRPTNSSVDNRQCQDLPLSMASKDAKSAHYFSPMD